MQHYTTMIVLANMKEDLDPQVRLVTLAYKYNSLFLANNSCPSCKFNPNPPIFPNAQWFRVFVSRPQ